MAFWVLVLTPVEMLELMFVFALVAAAFSVVMLDEGAPAVPDP